MTLRPQRVLALSPHPDDVELGCGAVLARWIREGAQVYLHAFSRCEQSLPPDCDADTLVREMAASAAVLGCAESAVAVFTVRTFAERRQEILDCLIHARALDPEVVLVPCSEDRHQDHAVIRAEALRAFPHATVLGYQLPWNCDRLDLRLTVAVSEADLDQQASALECYVSQARRFYGPQERAGWARTLGAALGAGGPVIPFEPLRVRL